MNETKTLDQKLKVGAMIGFITNIVSLIFCVLVFIILIAYVAVQPASTAVMAVLVITLLIKIGIAITLLCVIT
ncbi:hypothetical protein, partial [Spiroplasma sp. AdecLV25b]|uniref:hypothetical protein n=1 Tax=Spiroplasma sp. AdecLV25b TaxID=3027162 RepID=UPI0027E08E3E